MKIAMFTNTYLPHVGGVARSVQTLASACCAQGHEVLIVAPESDGAEPCPTVLRVPAFQNFNGTDFSVKLPIPGQVSQAIADFSPDIIHSHHPFLLGDSALRTARRLQIPIVFTHHTLYERYTHYMPLDSIPLKRMAIQLATEYANLCDLVFAPSRSVAELLENRGVRVPVRTIPTGIDHGFFSSGNGQAFRQRYGIPAEAKVIGHTGRLAVEKNLPLLAKAVAGCLAAEPNAVLLLVGDGEALPEMLDILRPSSATADTEVQSPQVHAVGKLTGQPLADAYAAMDYFVFTSQSETQGLVLAEAMSAGLPVVALDGPGVREIVRDGLNGFLLPSHSKAADITAALHRLLKNPVLAESMSTYAREDSVQYGDVRCAAQAMSSYAKMIEAHQPRLGHEDHLGDRLLTSLQIEWSLLVEKVAAAAAAVSDVPSLQTLSPE